MNRSGLSVLVLAFSAWLLSSDLLEAQFNRDIMRKTRGRAEEKRERLLQEHTEYLQKARENNILEGLLQGDEGDQRRAAEALQRAALGRDGGVSSEQLEKERQASVLIEEASRNLSEDAKRIVASRAVVVAQATPVSGDPGAPPSALPNPGGVPLPKELKPKPLSSVEKRLVAEISAEGAVHFNSTTKVMVFTDEVVVDHSSFHLECDILEIILKPEVDLGGVETKPKEADVKADESVTSLKGDDTIDKAIARGGTVTITKKDAEGKLKTGKARYVMYDAKTGDITMRDYPQVQSGQSLMISTDASTIIVMKADGNHYAVGPHRMEIVPDEGKEKELEGAVEGAAVSVPGGNQ
jgi:lipopolysaccharide export system protein LptA